MENKETKVVRIHDVKIDQEYVQWLSEIKARYRNAQIKASIRINVEQLLFNWQLGRDLVVRKAEEKWGSGIVEQVSLDLQAEFPGSKGFSTTNLWYMKQWYQFYAGSAERIHQLGGEIQGSDIQINKKLHQLGGEILKPEIAPQHGVELPNLFALVPWRHHVEIIAKCKNVDEALFYIVHTASEGWSRQALMNSIKADFYHTSGGAITNFSEKLPAPQSKLAQAITKDTYDFGFISLPNDYEEEQLELALERQLTRFLLELGTGFSYLDSDRLLSPERPGNWICFSSTSHLTATLWLNSRLFHSSRNSPGNSTSMSMPLTT